MVPISISCTKISIMIRLKCDVYTSLRKCHTILVKMFCLCIYMMYLWCAVLTFKSVFPLSETLQVGDFAKVKTETDSTIP